ncbi:MAG TPA: DUF3857 and transglutaminase domain-containing protein, partial [Planctomycetota bacterium]|nr:DUF3857 and transglutaminase domain-containing protein [Planctomycetota bacterium]
MLTRILASFCLCLLSSSVAFAQASPDPIAALAEAAPFAVTPGALLAAGLAAQAVTPEAVVVCPLVEMRYSFDDEGRCAQTYRCVFRARTKAAAEGWASFSQLFAPWNEERPEIRARVVAADGEVRELDPRTIEEGGTGEDSDDLYTDRRRVRAPLPAMAAGVVVEEETVTRERAAVLPAAGEVHRWRFSHGVTVLRTRLVLEFPGARPLAVERHLLAERGIAERRTESGGRTTLVFEAGRLDPETAAESNLPPEAPRAPDVEFTTGTSWAAVAEAYAAVIDRQIAGAATATALARELAAGATGAREVAGRIMARIARDVRYTGIEFAEAAVVPHPPAEVLERRYGDCKDQAALVVAMLRAAGVPAHVALLWAGTGEDVDPALPGLGLFNHAIVYVPERGGEAAFWIDATSRTLRAGDLPLMDAGRHALVAAKGTTALSRTPEPDAAANAVVETREVFLAEDGPARVVETTEPRGLVEAGYRAQFDGDPAAIRASLERYGKEAYDAKTVTAV